MRPGGDAGPLVLSGRLGDAFLAVHCSMWEPSGAPKLLAAEWRGCLSEGLRVWLGSCRRLGELLPSPLSSLHVLSSGCRGKRFLSPLHGDKGLLACRGSPSCRVLPLLYSFAF